MKEIYFKQHYIKIFEKLSTKCYDNQEKDRSFFLEILLDIIKSPSSALKTDPLFVIFIKKNILPHLTTATLS